MNRLHALIVCSFLFLSSTISYSQTFQNVPLFIRANADNVSLDEGEEIFRVRNAWLNRIKNGSYDNIQIQIPSNEGSYTLLASKRQIVPDDGIKVTTESGQYFQEDGGQHYFGTIAGAGNSTVIISSIEEKLHILIQDTNRKIRVIKNHPDISDRYLSLETSEFDNIINCGSSEESKGLKNGSPSLNRSTGNCNVVCDSPCSGTTDVHVYYEFDFISFLDENSSINDCITFMTMTHAVINHIYSNIDQVANNQHAGHPNLSSDINMIFSGFHIWDSPDPYPIEIFARRTAFQTVRPTFDGDVAHLINKGTINAGGIASIDLDDTSASLCDNGNPPAGGFTPHYLSFLTAAPVNFANTFSFGTALIAHEIGHTLGGRHPNECKWYDNNDFAIHRDMGTCEIFPTPACNHPTCTITTGYNPTIMSRCWFTNSPANTIDYTNPFHREIALNILDNLCNINLCYVPCNSDNDLDGFCTNDPNECDDNNPTIPGVVGQPCSDGNSQTVDDMFVVDSSTPDPNLSCICAGTLWSNPIGTDACNLIIGGPLDFEDDMVGAAQGTWYGGLQTGWTTSPGNTPDIGHGLVAGNCEQFIGLAGSWNSNATPPRVGIKEGLAIELSTPIPCNVGQFHLSFDYGLINTNGNQPFTNDLINVQGSEALIMMMPHDCPHSGVECLTTLGNPSLVTAHDNFNSVFSNNCTVNLDFAAQPASTVINNASFDMNFIYLSFDVDANMPDGVHEVLLDNIAINILPQSYGNPSSFTNECIIETIDHSIYCEIDLQRFNGSDWESVSFNTISTSEYVDSGFKMVSRVIDFEVLDCADYRIVQTCPPGGVDESCDTRVIDVDLSNCDNNLVVELITSPSQDTFCTGDQVILYDPDYAGFDAVWSSPLWPSDTMTTTTQLTLANELSVDSVGTHLFSVTVTDGSGCTGTDDINLTFVDCPLPQFVCCNTLVNFDLDMDVSNKLSYWLNNLIPNSFSNGRYTLSNKDFCLSGSGRLEIDVPIDIIDCDWNIKSAIDITSDVLFSNCKLQPCTSRWTGIFVKGGAHLATENGTKILDIWRRVELEPNSSCDISDTHITGSQGNSWGGIYVHWEAIDAKIHNTTIDGGFHGINAYGPSEIINCTISNFHIGIQLDRDWPATIDGCNISQGSNNYNFPNLGLNTAIQGTNFADVDILNNTISDCMLGLDFPFPSDLIVDNNDISTQSSCIRVGGGYQNNEIRNNELVSQLAAPIILNSSKSIVDNNIITNNGSTSGIYCNDMRELTITNNDIMAGGVLGFWSLAAIYNGGTMPGSVIKDNVITARNSQVVQNINSPDVSVTCNDMVSSPDPWWGYSFYNSGVYNQTNCDDLYMEANTLQTYKDIYTESTIRDQNHTGNCFNGELVEANGLSNSELLFSTFFVDSTVDHCYLPNNPPSWLRDEFDNGTTLTCSGLPGSGNGIDPNDTTRVCRYLEFLNEQLQDTTRRDLTLMRLISLFRMYNDTTVTEETLVPDCLKIYLDTTSICGIKMLLTMDSLVTSATLGSDTIRFQIQVQSTLTYLTLLQWRNYKTGIEGNTQAEKDSLRQVYITELTKLKTLIQIKRDEEERIWTVIDSIQIVECLDSIFMLEMLAIQLMPKDSFSLSEQRMIDGYARRCAKEYGRGIHIFRALAARFSEEDYRQYDLDCGTPEEQSLEQRVRIETNRKILISPNPSQGDITINISDHEAASELYISDIVGNIYLQQENPVQSQKIRLEHSGVYIITVTYYDGQRQTEKILVVE